MTLQKLSNISCTSWRKYYALVMIFVGKVDFFELSSNYIKYTHWKYLLFYFIEVYSTEPDWYRLNFISAFILKWKKRESPFISECLILCLAIWKSKLHWIERFLVNMSNPTHPLRKCCQAIPAGHKKLETVTSITK